MGVQVLGYGNWQVIAALLRHPFDAVFFEFHDMAGAFSRFVRAVQPGCQVIVDSVDLHYLREAAKAGVTAGDAWQTQTAKRELAAYRASDTTIVVTPEEQQELRIQGIEHVVVVPIIVPVIARTNRSRDAMVLFVGGFRHLPNVDAVLWFVVEVWPLIIAEVPQARFVIVGSEVPSAIQALHGLKRIDVQGFVQDTAPLLDAAQVSVAPLTYGAGMKGKVSEALAAGVPVVTTSWGAQGLTEGAGSAYLQADDPSGFAKAVIGVLQDGELRSRLGANGVQLARRLCSMETATPALRGLVAATLSNHHRPGIALRVWRFCAHVGKRRVNRTLARLTGRRSVPANP